MKPLILSCRPDVTLAASAARAGDAPANPMAASAAPPRRTFFTSPPPPGPSRRRCRSLTMSAAGDQAAVDAGAWLASGHRERVSRDEIRDAVRPEALRDQHAHEITKP